MLHWEQMLTVLRHRALKLVFAANMISMIGSGMNTAAVTWYVLQVTHSEVALGTLLMLQTIPALKAAERRARDGDGPVHLEEPDPALQPLDFLERVIPGVFFGSVV